MRLLNYLCRRVWRLSVVGVLNEVIDALEILVNRQGQVNWLVHLLVFIFDVRSCYYTISIKQTPEDIAVRNYEEAGIINFVLLRYVYLTVLVD